MAKIYTSTIKSDKGNTIRVDIYKDSSSASQATELSLDADMPVRIEYNCDDLFQPLKTSTCSVSVITDEPLLSLYTGKLTEVQAYVYRNNTLIWFGYLSPNIYQMDYDGRNDKLVLEFVDPLRAMESVKFKKAGSTWLTFHQLIDGAISALGASQVLTADISTAATVSATQVGCLQRNFIDESEDEDDGAMTWAEVVTEICKYMNVQAVSYGSKIYLTVPGQSGSVKTLAMAGNDAKISIGSVYNKMSIVANSNPMEDLFDQDIMDSHYYNLYKPAYKGNLNWNNTYKMYLYQSTIEEETYTRMMRYYTTNEGSKWTLRGFYRNADYNTYSGVTGYWASRYVNSDGVPTTIEWQKSVLLQCQGNTDAQLAASKPECYLTFSTGVFSIVKGGYLVLNIKYFYSTEGLYGHQGTGDDLNQGKTVRQMLRNRTIFDTVSDEWTVMLKVGGKYWNGTAWSTTQATFKVRHTWKAEDVMIGTEVSIDNSVSWEMALNDAVEGVAIPIDSTLSGSIQCTIYAPDLLGSVYDRTPAEEQGAEDEVQAVEACHITGITLNWLLPSSNIDGIGEADKRDLTYTEEMDADNVEEAEDEEMRINTYSQHQPSYSYAITSGPDFYQPATLPEERRLSRYINHMKEPRLQFSGTVEDSGLRPYDRMTVPAFSARGQMAVMGITYDLYADEAQVELKEIGTLS